jgi:hypothetical protein
MRNRTRDYVGAAVYLGAWAALGIGALPLFQRIFAEWLMGPSLPGLTIKLLRFGPTGCLAVGLMGAACIVAADEIVSSVVLRRSLLLALSVPLVAAVGVLVWPLTYSPMVSH